MTAYVDEVDGVFFTDRSAATDEEFRARFDRFGIFDEERIVEEVARALMAPMPEWRGGPDVDYWRMRAAAAITAYRATQDGGAEEAVRRVEALAAEIDAEAAEAPEMPFPTTWAAKRIRAALAPQAGDGAR